MHMANSLIETIFFIFPTPSLFVQVSLYALAILYTFTWSSTQNMIMTKKHLAQY